MTNQDELEIVLRVLLALGLGAAIGFEREYRGHEAGIRTFGLACVGAAIFGVASHGYGDSRIAAGVVQGIGFLGAGIIFHRDGGIAGLTTAVTIWAVAAIGLLVAEEMYIAASLLTAAIIIVLELSPVSEWIVEHGHPDASALRLRELLRREAESEE